MGRYDSESVWQQRRSETDLLPRSGRRCKMRPGSRGSPIAPGVALLPNLAIDVSPGACSRRLGGDEIEDIRPGGLRRQGTDHHLDWTPEVRHRVIQFYVVRIRQVAANHDGFLHETSAPRAA